MLGSVASLNSVESGRHITSSSVPRFQVISIRPDRSAGPTESYFRDDEYVARRITAKRLIATAYGTKVSAQMLGVPKWADSDRFQIEAKVRGKYVEQMTALRVTQRRRMLIQILRERFNLRDRVTQRKLAVYLLTVSKNGTHFEHVENRRIKGSKLISGSEGIVILNNGVAHGKNVSMSTLVRVLQPFVKRLIIDGTGLTGRYTFNFEIPSSRPSNAADTVNGEEKGDGVDSGQNALRPVSVFDAVRELGLRLKATKEMVPIVIIDHMEYPSAN